MATERRERIEMRVDAETKQLAERVAAALGCAALTEFMVRLIRDNALGILQAQAAVGSIISLLRIEHVCNFQE